MKARIGNFSFLLAAVIYTILASGHGVSEADKSAMLSGGLLEYAILGAKHMVTGYDHLLFIFGVVFLLSKFSEIVKFITAFTIGHSITLICATFMGITANPFLIDAVIALTVVYKGFDNIGGFEKYLKISPPNILVLVFVFGLIHGFGLSTRLQELPLNHDGLLLDIISFNVGVEVGQVAALTVMMLILAGWRKTASFARFSIVANIGLMIAGAVLMATQIHGYLDDHHAHDDHHEHKPPKEQVMMKETAPEVKSGHSHSHGGHSHKHEKGGPSKYQDYDHDHGH